MPSIRKVKFEVYKILTIFLDQKNSANRANWWTTRSWKKILWKNVFSKNQQKETYLWYLPNELGIRFLRWDFWADRFFSYARDDHNRAARRYAEASGHRKNLSMWRLLLVVHTFGTISLFFTMKKKWNWLLIPCKSLPSQDNETSNVLTALPSLRWCFWAWMLALDATRWTRNDLESICGRSMCFLWTRRSNDVGWRIFFSWLHWNVEMIEIEINRNPKPSLSWKFPQNSTWVWSRLQFSVFFHCWN